MLRREGSGRVRQVKGRVPSCRPLGKPAALTCPARPFEPHPSPTARAVPVTPRYHRSQTSDAAA